MLLFIVLPVAVLPYELPLNTSPATPLLAKVLPVMVLLNEVTLSVMPELFELVLSEKTLPETVV